MKVKICGITTVEDARFCTAMDVDFIGLVFVPDSRRFVPPDLARRLVETVRTHSATTRVVGVFRDASADVMHGIAADAQLDFLQLHGSESPEIVASLDVPVIKAFGMKPAMWTNIACSAAELEKFGHYPSAAWFLYDTSPGGTGARFDWSLIPRADHPFFLAGGLSPENIREAIERVKPDGIDVSSGVERAPGRKDHSRIEALLAEVRR